MLTNAVPPPTDPTPDTKMSINGNPVSDATASVISPIQKSRASKIANPLRPLTTIAANMLNGMTFCAC